MRPSNHSSTNIWKQLTQGKWHLTQKIVETTNNRWSDLGRNRLCKIKGFMLAFYSRIDKHWIINQREKRQKREMASRLKWTTEEEEHIKYLREVAGLESWKEIAEKLNEDIPESNRSGKQCRERYINYVRFTENNNKSPSWTKEDDEKFTSLYFQHGAKWASIVRYMPEKSQNCLKNRFYGGLRRIIRKINRVEKVYKMRKSKPLRYETLLRVLDYRVSKEAGDSSPAYDISDFETFLIRLKTNLLQCTWDLLNSEVSDENIVDLIMNVHEFNARIRGLTFKPTKNFQKIKGKLIRVKSKDEKVVETMVSETQATGKNFSCCYEEPEDDLFDCLELSCPIQQEPIKCQNEIILPEMTCFFPKMEQLDNGEEFDAEVCRILQIDHTPMTFSFFQ